MKTSKKRRREQQKSPAERSAQLLGHRIRIEALTILIERVASPNQIAQEIGESLELVGYHINILAKADAIELVNEVRRGGASEHFYRAARRPELTHEEWLELSERHKAELAVMGIRNLFAESLAAVETGKMVQDQHMYFWWKASLLDPQGREEMKNAQEDHVARLLEIEAASNARAIRSGGPSDQAPAVMAVLGFDRARRDPVNEVMRELS